MWSSSELDSASIDGWVLGKPLRSCGLEFVLCRGIGWAAACGRAVSLSERCSTRRSVGRGGRGRSSCARDEDMSAVDCVRKARGRGDAELRPRRKLDVRTLELESAAATATIGDPEVEGNASSGRSSLRSNPRYVPFGGGRRCRHLEPELLACTRVEGKN